MAVFVSASDESDSGHHRSRFWHCGWVAPLTEWTDYFVPAWQERVLDAKPRIPFLHMTDIRDPGWRNEHGITWQEAQDKMDEAAIVIDQMGSLYPLAVHTDAGVFLDAHGKKKVMEGLTGSKKPMRFLVDHYSFHAYVYLVLHYIRAAHPDAEKVDFIVERKDGVFEKLKQFHEEFGNSLRQLGHPELAQYLGELSPAGKDRVPVQAADMLAWHASRGLFNQLHGRDQMRANTIFHRRGKVIELHDKIHFDIASGFKEKMAQQEKDEQFKKFDRTMEQLLKVPHSDIKARLDEEKAGKQQKRKAKKPSASHRAGDGKG